MFNKLVRKRLEEFIKKEASDKKVLDIGCGKSPYAKYFPQCISLDIKPGAGVDVVGDIHNLPFQNESFEMILCTEVLEHVLKPTKAIKEMQRVLKTGGKLILTTRFIYPLHDTPEDYWRFTKYGLQELFKDWEVEELREEYGTIDTMGVLWQRLALQSKTLFKFSKIIFFFLPTLIKPLKILLKREYGDITRTKVENSILVSGYYLICRKR